MTAISFIEPAPRCHLMAISTAELSMLVRYHRIYQRGLETDLPRLLDEHCKGNAAHKEAIVKLAATQLAAHQTRLDELEGLLNDAQELAAELEPSLESLGPQIEANSLQ